MLAITNAKLLTVTQGVIDKGTILVENGKIKALGADVAVPEGATVIDASGKVVSPGIVEAHSHLGLYGGMADVFDGPQTPGTIGPATTPELDAVYLFNPRSESLRTAYQNGVTTVITGPGSGKVIGGQSFVAKTFGEKIDDMIMLSPAGMKMAFGENPKRNFGSRGQMPSTRMGTAASLRDALVKCQNYLDRQEKARQRAEKEGKEPELPPVDLKMEALAKVLRREIPARIHAHRADDIMTVLRIRDEFDLDITIEHSTEAYKVAHEIAKRNIPCIVGPSFVSRLKVELVDITFDCPGILEQAGIKVAITTDAPVVPIEYLRTSASLAVKQGMSLDGAFRAITINAAEIAGVAERVGSLDVGKDADLLVLDGHPLDLTSRIEKVFVDGQLAYDRDIDKEPWEK